MIEAILWCGGGFLASLAVFQGCELVFFGYFRGRIRAIGGEDAESVRPDNPLGTLFPAGPFKIHINLSRKNWPVLEEVFSLYNLRLQLLGSVAGLLAAVAAYGALFLASPPPFYPFLMPFFLPLIAVWNLGAKTVRKDRGRFGEVYAVLNQTVVAGLLVTSAVVSSVFTAIRIIRFL